MDRTGISEHVAWMIGDDGPIGNALLGGEALKHRFADGTIELNLQAAIVQDIPG